MSQLEDSVLDDSRPPAQAGPKVVAKVEEAPAAQATPQIYGVVAAFDDPESLLEAVRTARQNGYDTLDTYTPFPIHGIEEALGLRRSNLGWIVAGMGALGAATAILLQWWVGALANPLVIGGKPLFALQPSIPITFELTVLFASFTAMLGMLLLNGLPRLYHPVFNHSQVRRATDDLFLLAIESDGPDFDAMRAVKVLNAAGGRHTEVVSA